MKKEDDISEILCVFDVVLKQIDLIVPGQSNIIFQGKLILSYAILHNSAQRIFYWKPYYHSLSLIVVYIQKIRKTNNISGQLVSLSHFSILRSNISLA